MRSKVTLVLLFLNVALFFFIFYFERDWRIERASQEARHRVLGVEAAAIRSLEVTGTAPGTSFSLALRGDTWFLTSPVEWPANPVAVSHILNELQVLENITSFPTKDLEKNGQKLADYGLDQPRLTLSFSSGDQDSSSSPKPTVLRIGDTTKVGDHLYILSSDGEKIHVVNRSLADSLTVPFDELRSDVIISIPAFEARSLNLQTASPSSVRVRLDREGSRWLFRTPVQARAAKNATDLAINNLDGLRVKAFVLQNPPAPPSAAPALRVTIEGNNRHETLFIGGKTGTDDDYFAQLEDRPVIFTVAIGRDLMETLRDSADVLRDRHILDFDPAAVTSISLSALNQPEISLQRLESAAGGHDAAWQIIRRGGAAQPSEALPADSAAVQRLLDRLETLSALRFQSDAPTNADIEEWGFNRPEREVTLTLGGTTSTQTLQIGLPTKRENVAYARIAGLPSVYAVEPDILKETSALPLAWRQRLLSTLPESARITSLTLSVVADGSAVYSRKLADGETWEHALAQETPARREAVDTILAQLRSLHAAALVDEGFPDKVLAAGEMRPWKYRLDAVVSLPGGSGQLSTTTLWFAERTGGSEQLAGSKEIGAVFTIEQPLLDALYTLTQP